MTPPMTSRTEPCVLVVAKAPVPGRAKTRLAATVGERAAAELAAAALIDTLEAAAALGPGHLALAGDLDEGVWADEIRAALVGWTISAQRGDDFASRLEAAHLDAGPGPVLQVGMDTPQITPELLHQAARGLDDHDAVLGPAADGGWWVLGRTDPTLARHLVGVPMSTEQTHDLTRAALQGAGASVATTATLVDVDTAADAALVAETAPQTRFATLWRDHAGVTR